MGLACCLIHAAFNAHTRIRVQIQPHDEIQCLGAESKSVVSYINP